MWALIKKFFGFGQGERMRDTEEVYKGLLEKIGSHEKSQSVNATAYQIIVKKQPLTPKVAHPYEVTITGDCLAVDAAISNHYSSKLKKFAGDAAYVEQLLQGGVSNELVGAQPTGIELQVKANIAQHQALADELRIKKETAEKDLHHFRQASNLLTSAAPPDKSDAMKIIIAVAVVEAIVNWLFLRTYQSPIIATLIAAGAAVMNVGGSVYFGASYRYKNHIDPDIAKRGRLNMSFAIALILGLNGILAIFRLWYTEWSLSPLILLEIIMLFGIGVFLGVAAFNKGYALDDPYPGHGDLTRRAAQAGADWADLQKQHAVFCEKLKKDAVDTHANLVNRIRANSNQLMALLPEMKGTITGWVQAREQLNNAYRALQQQFKTALRNAHPEGADYPMESLDLPHNALLDNFKVLSDRFTVNQKEMERRIATLISEVDSSRDSLQKWMATSAAEKLWRWPN